MILGYNNYRYEAVPGWGKNVGDYRMGVVSGVATDSQDRVYVIDREPNAAMVVFDRDGKLLTTWGQDVLKLPHEVWISADEKLYIADCGDHTVKVCTPDGKVLQTIGNGGQPGAPGKPFNMPTRAIIAPNGEMYVSDGYKQNYVHRFSADGTLLQTWGGTGSGPGQFSLPHNVFAFPDGRIIVADREPNHRMQVFDAKGKFLAEWPGRLIPCGLFVDADSTLFVAEGGGISIFNADGRLLSRFEVRGGPDDVNHGVHALWVDRHGDIYTGEVGAPDLYYKFKRV
jgi:hypothetical protein